MPWENVPENIRAYGLVTPNEEMGYAAMKIHEYVSVKNYRYRDIAVVASDMNLYRGSAQYWFDKYQIPCFFDGRRNISGNMMIEWLRSLCGIFVQKYSYAAVFRYIRSGLSGIAEEEAVCWKIMCWHWVYAVMPNGRKSGRPGCRE